jgi:hypothetical protein
MSGSAMAVETETLRLYSTVRKEEGEDPALVLGEGGETITARSAEATRPEAFLRVAVIVVEPGLRPAIMATAFDPDTTATAGFALS